MRQDNFLVEVKVQQRRCVDVYSYDLLRASWNIHERKLHLISWYGFTVQVAAQKGWKEEVEYTGVLFQPIPWTRTERHGMPKACEKYLNDSENHVIVNVPPTFMFKAKIFKPSRLAAIFRKKGAPEPKDE